MNSILIGWLINAVALACYAAFDDPVVATRYFWLGPGSQNETIDDGYSKAAEDQLLESINWPEDGYRRYSLPLGRE